MSYFSVPITTEGLRHHNRATVLSALRRAGPLSHTEIIKHTNLASGTVSVITTEFLEENVLEKLEQANASGRGRPRILFGPRGAFAFVLLIRISADTITCSLVDYCGILLDRRIYERDLTQSDAKDFIHSFRQIISEFIARSDLDKNRISIVSIISKGEIDEARQTLLWSPILDYQVINFNHVFEDWSAMIELSNEACYVAHNKLNSDFFNDQSSPGDAHAVLSWSDSISLGVATLGEEGGIKLTAPSFGHMHHGTGDSLCRCGAQSCLEAYAGFYGILRTAFEAPKNAIPAKFIPIEQMQNLAQNARAGDRMTIYAFQEAGRALGLGLARLFNLLDPMPVTIVGAGAEFFDLIQVGMRESISNSFLARMGRMLEVVPLIEGTQLAFESNVSLSLESLDKNRVATKKYLEFEQ